MVFAAGGTGSIGWRVRWFRASSALRMIQEIEVVLFLLGVISLLAVLAARWRFPFAVLLVLAGVAIGLVPGLPHVEVEPDAVFLLILPPLLFSAAVMFPWRELQENLRPILGLAVILVLVTMTAVAFAAWWVIPGLSLAAAFVLGAIVSPPDAIAANSILARLRVPRRMQTVLEGESLINDASGLVAWKFAVAAMVTGAFSLREATVQFFVMGFGGVAIGFVLSWLVAAVLRRVGEPVVELTLFLMTPYLVYVAAELAGVSGVLAAVAAGMVIGHRSDEIFSPRARLDSAAVWGFVQHLLNSVVFIIIGLQFPVIMAGLSPVPWSQLALYLGVVAGVVIFVRFAWFFLLNWVLHRSRPVGRPTQDSAPKRELLVMSWCGMRGVVSMAAALAVPEFMADGQPVAQRDLILFLTFGVIFITLLGPTLTLPALVRWMGFVTPGATAEVGTQMRVAILQRGREALDAAAEHLDGDGNERLVQALRDNLDSRIRRQHNIGTDAAGGHFQPLVARRLIRETAAEMRIMVRDLGWRGEIDTHLRNRLREELDAEEVRLLHWLDSLDS